MAKTNLQELADLGQSVWLDYISRSLLAGNRLKEMIGLGLRGMTSNPTIFDKAITGSGDYDIQIKELAGQGKTPLEIYDYLTIKDIQAAADIFLPVYEQSGGRDGYISLEINPELCHKAEETIEEGLRLQGEVGRKNLMVKVPATDAGITAIEQLVARGVNVNATLIFSCGQYARVAEAYIKGLSRRAACGEDLGCLHSVASVFVSRVDTAVDKLLADNSCLRGRAAVVNSAIIYKKYRDIFASGEFAGLKDKGANLQRVLWGSTGTKNPAYSDVKYVEELIGRDTVNTMPEKTLEAVLDHLQVSLSLEGKVDEAQQVISQLRELNIDIDEICARLLSDGLDAFKASFSSLLRGIEEKGCALGGA